MQRKSHIPVAKCYWFLNSMKLKKGEAMLKQKLELHDTKEGIKIKIADNEIRYVTGYSVSHDLSGVVLLELKLLIPREVIEIAVSDCELK